MGIFMSVPCTEKETGRGGELRSGLLSSVVIEKGDILGDILGDFEDEFLKGGYFLGAGTYWRCSRGVSQYGYCGMQGWRRNMEDSQVAIAEFDFSNFLKPSPISATVDVSEFNSFSLTREVEEHVGQKEKLLVFPTAVCGVEKISKFPPVGIFAVFDGHGGASVSNWINRRFGYVFAVELSKLVMRPRSPVTQVDICHSAVTTPSQDEKVIPSQDEHALITLALALRNTFLAIDLHLRNAACELQPLEDIASARQNLVLAKCDKQAPQSRPEQLKRLLGSLGCPTDAMGLDDLKDDDSTDTPEESDGVVGTLEEGVVQKIRESERKTDRQMEENEEKIDEIEEKIEKNRIEETNRGEEMTEKSANKHDISHQKTDQNEEDETDINLDATTSILADGDEDERDSLLNSFSMERVSRGGSAMYVGATGVCVLLAELCGGRHLLCLNAGDSRALLCRGGGTSASLSRDHKPQDCTEMARIYDSGGYVEGGRVCGNLNLSRALGDLAYKHPSLSGSDHTVSGYGDLRYTTLKDDDEFLFVACDGVWERFHNAQAIRIVRKHIYACLARKTHIHQQNIANHAAKNHTGGKNDNQRADMQKTTDIRGAQNIHKIITDTEMIEEIIGQDEELKADELMFSAVKCEEHDVFFDEKLKKYKYKLNTTELATICQRICDQCLAPQLAHTQVAGCDNITCMLVQLNTPANWPTAEQCLKIQSENVHLRNLAAQAEGDPQAELHESRDVHRLKIGAIIHDLPTDAPSFFPFHITGGSNNQLIDRKHQKLEGKQKMEDTVEQKIGNIEQQNEKIEQKNEKIQQKNLTMDEKIENDKMEEIHHEDEEMPEEQIHHPTYNHMCDLRNRDLKADVWYLDDVFQVKDNKPVCEQLEKGQTLYWLYSELESDRYSIEFSGEAEETAKRELASKGLIVCQNSSPEQLEPSPLSIQDDEHHRKKNKTQ